jgi:hypothetical protein
MRKILITKSILFLCLISSACSYLTEFVVVNNSNLPIEIEYKITSQVDSLEHTATKPFKMNFSDWDSWFGKNKGWQEVSQDGYEFESQSRTCRIKLEAGKALLINWENENRYGTYDNFRITSLRLKGDNGEVIYRGESIYKQFNKKDDHNYFIEYK